MVSGNPVNHVATMAASTAADSVVGGNSVAQILRAHCPAHASAAGIVIARLDARAGVWQYSVDNGAHWRDARSDLINRPGVMGLALDREARVRLLPRSGERVGHIHLVLHAVQHSLHNRNGSHSAYVPDPSEGDSSAISLMLDINDINGTPPQVHVPRLRNKRAMARAKAQTELPAQSGVPAPPDRQDDMDAGTAPVTRKGDH